MEHGSSVLHEALSKLCTGAQRQERQQEASVSVEHPKAKTETESTPPLDPYNGVLAVELKGMRAMDSPAVPGCPCRPHLGWLPCGSRCP
jgi:hypothetical protein